MPTELQFLRAIAENVERIACWVDQRSVYVEVRRMRDEIHALRERRAVEKSEPLGEQCSPFIEALEGYIDGLWGIFIKYKMPAADAADFCKHMHSAVIGIRRRLSMPFDPNAGKTPAERSAEETNGR